MLYTTLLTIIHPSVCPTNPKVVTHTHITVTLPNSSQYTPHSHTSALNVTVSHPAFLLDNETFLNSSYNFSERNKFGLLKPRRQTLKFACKLMSMNQVDVKPAVILKAVPLYLSTIYRGFEKNA